MMIAAIWNNVQVKSEILCYGVSLLYRWFGSCFLLEESVSSGRGRIHFRRLIVIFRRFCYIVGGATNLYVTNATRSAVLTQRFCFQRLL
jgi:hypothetical protein